MIKLYTDHTFLNEKNRRLVFPLLFDMVFLKNKDLLSYYTFVDNPEEANVIVFPTAYHHFQSYQSAYDKLLNLASKHQKTVWVYTSGDFGFTLNYANCITFRLGGFKTKLNENTQILPSFINDPYTSLNKYFSTITKQDKPTVGFVGHAESGLKKYAKEYLSYLKLNAKQLIKPSFNDYQPFYPSGYKRANYLSSLVKSNELQTNFIFRNKYRAGVVTEKEKEKTTQEFYANMYTNAYNLCLRGVGNFSVRFYETLAMGRVPILIDTDCKLPLETIIDWEKHVLIIKESELNKLEEVILTFHNQFSQEAFIKLQESNRNLWLNSLERVSYFKQIHNKLGSNG